jgi:tyrosine-protein kinase Etk/Wzc
MKEKLMPTTEMEAPELAIDPAHSRKDEIDLLDLLIIVARRKGLILKVTVAAAVLAIVVSLLMPNRYTAIAVIMPPQQTQSTASMMMNQLAGSGLGSLAAFAGKDLGLKNPNDLYISMLKSRTVEDAIVAKFGFQKIYGVTRLSDSRRELERATTIKTGKDTLINISFEDKDPKRSAEVANAYVEELRNLTKQLAVSEASQRRVFFEQQLEQAKEDLANAEIGLKETQQKTGMIQLDSQSRALIEAVGRIRAQIAAKEVQLQAIGSFATEQNPDRIMVEQELAGLRSQLTKFEQANPSDKGDPLVATAKIPSVGLEYVRRYREVKYREAMFELLAKQFEAAKLDEAKQAAVIQVVDPATVPDRKSSPLRAWITIIAVLVGFGLSVMFVIAYDVFKVMCRDRTFTERLGHLSASFRRTRSADYLT